MKSFKNVSDMNWIMYWKITLWGEWIIEGKWKSRKTTSEEAAIIQGINESSLNKEAGGEASTDLCGVDWWGKQKREVMSNSGSWGKPRVLLLSYWCLLDNQVEMLDTKVNKILMIFKAMGLDKFTWEESKQRREPRTKHWVEDMEPEMEAEEETEGGRKTRSCFLRAMHMAWRSLVALLPSTSP